MRPLIIIAAVVGGVFLLMRHRTVRDIDLVKKWEGLELAPYQDSAGLWTIGYGHLLDQSQPLPGPIDQDQAEQLLDTDLAEARAAVDRLVKVPLTEGQRAALVSFTFNLGAGNLERSTLLRKLNAGDYTGAGDELLRWNKAGGRVVAGLVNRREYERQVFLA